MSEYTPSTEQVRLAARDMYANRVSGPAFDRWLDAEKAKWQAEAWHAGVQHGISCEGGAACPLSANPYEKGSDDDR